MYKCHKERKKNKNAAMGAPIYFLCQQKAVNFFMDQSLNE